MLPKLIAANELPALLYHHVGPLRPGIYRSLTVEPRRFQQDLDWLRRHGYRSASIDQVTAWAVEGRELPDRSVLITFDDGYAELADTAFPILRAAGYFATVFIVTGAIGDSNSWKGTWRREATVCLTQRRSDYGAAGESSSAPIQGRIPISGDCRARRCSRRSPVSAPTSSRFCNAPFLPSPTLRRGGRFEPAHRSRRVLRLVQHR